MLLLWALGIFLAGLPALAADIRSYHVESEFQRGKQQIRVLTPDNYESSQRYRVLYVLPVEPGFESHYGYGLGTLKEMNAHNRHNLIIVQMGFEREPWYGDHATDPQTRQASYIKDFVVPFIEKNYSTKGNTDGRLLLGFSKSGWGAFSLILKHPDVFGYAASWDAPMFLPTFRARMKDVYGTLAQLEAYRPDLLISKNKAHFLHRNRLVLTGEIGWGTSSPTPSGKSHTVAAHELLQREGIQHHYDNTLRVEHRWHKAWLEPTLDALMRLTQAK